MGEGNFIKSVASSACRSALRPLPLRLEDESFAPTAYFVGYTDEVEKGLFLRRFAVPFWALT
jgi:hypothetical protein